MVETLIIAAFAAVLGVLVTLWVVYKLHSKVETRLITHSIAERVRSVGKLVGLEVMSKEIVTQTRGLGWLPPLLLSQARLAMIFCFEKQYYVNLSKIRNEDVIERGPGQFSITLPAIEGQLTLLDVTPYDIQSGKFLGLVDVFRMDAETQKTLMQRAQEEAGSLYEAHASRYEDEARRAVTRHMTGLMDLFDVEIKVRFQDQKASAAENGTVETKR